jgi:hypothetical protein
VVKSSDPGEGDDLPSDRRLDGAGDWRVAAERHVRPVAVVVGDVVAHGAKEMPLTHDDEVRWSSGRCAHSRSGGS